MSSLDKYKIINVFLQGVPKIPYADGVGKFRGVCGHATANYGSGQEEDTAQSEKNWEQNNWETAFVHYFCDYSAILDVADDNYLSYGCSGGNPYFVNFELCQTKDSVRFNESYDRWVWVMAYTLFKHRLGVTDGVTLVSHRWVSQHYSGTHDDPHAYIESHGKNWQDVVNDVASYYNQFEEETKMLEQLQAQVQALTAEVQNLKKLANMPIPDFAKEVIGRLEQNGTMKDPDMRSYDLYATLAILGRNKVL